MKQILNKNKFSKATIEIAKRNLREFKEKSDRDFLVRAEIDKKLKYF